MPGYGSDEGFTEWAEGNGYTIPDGVVAAARQRGSVYIDGVYDQRFPGTPTGGADQERSWPRTGATDRYGNAIGPAIVPARVVNAAYEATRLELADPGSLSALTSGAGAIKREKIGELETEYIGGASGSVTIDATPVSTLIEGILSPLLIRTDYPAVLVA